MKADYLRSETSLKQKLAHARAAYIHAVGSLPDPLALENGPILQNGLEFRSYDEIRSQFIELGWAFFCRYEACLERWLKSQNIRLGKKRSLYGYFVKQGITITEENIEGLKIDRSIRNKLHHDDGENFEEDQLGTEIHIKPQHLERFFDLFCWIEKAIEDERS